MIVALVVGQTELIKAKKKERQKIIILDPYNSQKIKLCFFTHHVCAVGRLANVGAAVIWKRGLSCWKPPGGSCEQPVVNCNSLAISSRVKLLTAVQNQSNTLRNSGEPPLAMWCARKSAMLYSPVPQSKSWKYSELDVFEYDSSRVEWDAPRVRSRRIYRADCLVSVRSGLGESDRLPRVSTKLDDAEQERRGNEVSCRLSRVFYYRSISTQPPAEVNDGVKTVEQHEFSVNTFMSWPLLSYSSSTKYNSISSTSFSSMYFTLLRYRSGSSCSKYWKTRKFSFMSSQIS